MSVSVLSLTRPLDTVSGLLQLASLLGLALLLLKAAQLYQRRQWMLKAIQQFPSPPSHWFFGHKQEFLTCQELQELKKRTEKYPCASPRWLWGSKVILITWFQHRRMLTPAFHYDILKPYVRLMADSVQVMLNSHLEIFEHVSLMTLDTIMKCAFSYQGNHQADSPLHSSSDASLQLEPSAPSSFMNSQSYIQAIKDLNYLVYSWVRNVFYQKDIFYWLTSKAAGTTSPPACPSTHRPSDQAEEGSATGGGRAGEGQEQEALGLPGHPPLSQSECGRGGLSICPQVGSKGEDSKSALSGSSQMENRRGLSDKDLRAEVDTFMFEGHDTTASGISWTLYTLATHPEHQQRCREEIQSLLGDGASITWEHQDEMLYTTMCIKEALRLYPPVPRFLVSLSFYALHHNPNVWPNPEHFAMNELKVAVALTLLRFELAPDPFRIPVPTPRIVLMSKNGIHLHLRKLL
ncbi:unnamed protein product [Nyctereutes procyonoides]|uniref:(raccoon dog) hypothetical protein n=1 Tax=Nyctereutes procyonoides TaxID=34880 RepID=A0A811Z5G6_NYCPR|nr:unnamed protein product [Nyctereutes procyonoides]